MTPDARWRVLVADPRSVRAIDETRLDILAERVEAAGAKARLWWLLRSVAAFARVVVRVIPFEFAAMAPSAWAGRVAAYSLVPLVLTMAHPVMQLSSARDLPAWLPIFLVPKATTVVLPFSVFLTSLWPPRRTRPAIAAPALVAVTLVTISVVATPVANQLFRSTVYAVRSGQSRMMDVPRRGLAEMTVPQLVRRSLAEPAGWQLPSRDRARQQLLILSGFVALAGAWTVWATVLARRGGRRWPWAVVMPVAAELAFGVLQKGGGLWAIAAFSLVAAWRLSPVETPDARHA
jgi:hypothetical protein